MQPLPTSELIVSDPAAPAEVPAPATPASGASDSGAGSSIRSRLKSGSVWALVGYGGGQLLRLVSSMVLWRLLYSDAFGLMALVNVFMQGLAMFSDVGIGPSIIQNERGDDPKYLNTAWTIQALRGFGLFSVAVIAAVPMARFYQEPELAALIPVVAAGSILAGFNSTKLFTVTRQIALGRLTAIDLGSQALGLLLMVVWGIVTRSIWALVIGGIATNLFRLVFGHLFLPGIKNGFRWDKASVHSLIHFGRWIFISTLLTFSVMSADRLIFGKLVSMSLLGVYSIATTWATFPSQILGHVFQSVLFPLLSHVHNSKGDVPAAYREARIPWLFGAGWLTACLVSGGPTLIRFCYDDRAAPAGWIVQILTVGTWFLALEMTNGSALLAQGRPKWVAAGSGAKLCGMAVLIPVGFLTLGFPGAVLGFAASEVFRYMVSLVGANRARLRGYKQDALLTVLAAATAAVGWATRSAIRRTGIVDSLSAHYVRLGAFFEGAVIFVAVTAAWGLLFATYRRRARSHPPMQPA